MYTTVGTVYLPDAAILELARTEQLERAEARQRAERLAEDEYSREVLAVQVHADMATRMAAVESRVARAEAEARRQREQRAVALDDLRTQLLAKGGRWRTVGEVLADLKAEPA